MAEQILESRYVNKHKLHSDVWRYTDKATGEYVTIKKVSYLESDSAEIAFLKKFSNPSLCHPNVICYRDIISDPNSYFSYIVMEYVEGIDLYEYLIKNSNQLTPENIINMMQQLITGLKFLHDNGIIHRDIASYNTMVRHDGTLKIIKFGTSCHPNGFPGCNERPAEYVFKDQPDHIKRFKDEAKDPSFIPKMYDTDLKDMGMIFYQLANDGKYSDEFVKDYTETNINNPVLKDMYNSGTAEQNTLINSVVNRALYIPSDPSSLNDRPTVDEIYSMLHGGAVTSLSVHNYPKRLQNCKIMYGSDTYYMDIYMEENTYQDIKNQLVKYIGLPNTISIYTGGYVRPLESVISESAFDGGYWMTVEDLYFK